MCVLKLLRVSSVAIENKDQEVETPETSVLGTLCLFKSLYSWYVYLCIYSFIVRLGVYLPEYVGILSHVCMVNRSHHRLSSSIAILNSLSRLLALHSQRSVCFWLLTVESKGKLSHARLLYFLPFSLSMNLELAVSTGSAGPKTPLSLFVQC